MLEVLTTTSGPESSQKLLQQFSPTIPTHIEGLKYLQTYLETFHNRLPFLDHAKLYRLHEDRHKLANSTSQGQWNSFKIFMVYSIGRATQVEESYSLLSSAQLFQTASQSKPPITKLSSTESIEAMLLLIMYSLRTKFSSNIWYIIGVAMRAAIDLGLHREASYFKMNTEVSQQRKRLFWSVYLMDRTISQIFGRPFNIAEHDLDVRLTENYEEPSQNFSSGQWPFERPNEIRTGLGAFIPSILLARLESEVQRKVYRVDKEAPQLLSEVPSLLSALEGYKGSLTAILPPIDCDWLYMHWNNGIRMLLQPFLVRASTQSRVNPYLHGSSRADVPIF